MVLHWHTFTSGVRGRLYGVTKRQRILAAVALTRLVEDRLEEYEKAVLKEVELFADGRRTRLLMATLQYETSRRHRAACDFSDALWRKHGRRPAGSGPAPDASPDAAAAASRRTAITALIGLAASTPGSRNATAMVVRLAWRLINLPFGPAPADVLATLDDLFPASRSARAEAGRAEAKVGAAVREMAAVIYANRSFEDMPVLADALEDAGVGDRQILEHCRGGGRHHRGCWVLDGLLDRGLKTRLLQEAPLKGGV